MSYKCFRKYAAIWLLTVGGVEATSAADFFWANSGAGDWALASNWTSNALPAAADRAQINNGGTAQLGTTSTVYSVMLGSNVLDRGTLQVSPGATLNVFLSGTARGFLVGDYGTGTLYQTGGTINYGQSSALQNVFSMGTQPGSSGAYTLSGGNLNVYSGSGYSAGSGFAVGLSSQGTWNVWGGTAQLRNLFVGKSAGSYGVVNQTNGAVNVGVTIAQSDESRIGGATSADLDAVGTYNISGGTLTNAGSYQIGGYGTGTNNISGTGLVSVGTWPSIARFPGSLGVVNVTGGTFIQSGAANSLIVGELGTGYLNVSGTGFVNAQSLVLGNGSWGNGTVNLDGGTIFTGSIRNQGGSGTFNFNGGTLRFRGNAAFNSPIACNVEPDGAYIDTGSFSVTIVPALLEGGGTLTKLGTGVLTLSGTNTYHGNTAVTAGTLVVNGSQAGGCSVSGGAVLTGTGTVAGLVNVTGSLQPGDPATTGPAQFGVGPLTLTAGAALNFRLSGVTNAGPPFNDLLTAGGSLALNSNSVTIVLLNTNLALGSYRLVNYTGSKSGSFGSVVHNTRYTLALDESVPHQINLVVSAGTSGNLRWTGATNAVWDLAATPNWLDTSKNTADLFWNLDRVLFDDTPSVPTGVTLASSVSPAGTVVNAGANNFVLSGTGKLSGAGGITKLGASTLTLNTANDFTGPVLVSGGILKAGNATALGSSAGPTIVTNASALDLNGRNLGAEPVIVSGAGPGASGAIVNSGAAQTQALRFLTLAGDTTLGGSGRWDVRTDTPASVPAALNGGGHALTKVGTNTIWLAGLGETSLGDISLRQGSLVFQTTTTMGNASRFLTLAPGTTLSFSDQTSPVSKTAFMTNAILQAPSGANVFAGPLVLSGANTSSLTATLELRGPISGSGSLIKTLAGTLLLSGTNTYIGDTEVSGGIVRAGGASALPSGFGKGMLQVDSGGTVDMNNSDLSVNTFEGSGVIQCTNGVRQLKVGGTGLSDTFSGRILGLNGGASYPVLFKQGSGAFILSGTADNAWAGAIVNAGTLVLSKGSSSSVHALGAVGDALVVNPGGSAQLSGSGEDQIPDVRDILMNGGTLDLNGRNETINVLHGTNGLVLNSAAFTTNTLTLGGGSGTGTFAGSLQDGNGTLALTKIGTGTITLVGSNSYNGTTLVTQGWLLVNGQVSGLGSNLVSAGAGLAGSGVISGAVRVTGALQTGTPTVSAPATLGLGSLTLDAGAALAFRLSGVTNIGGVFNDLLNIAGDLVLSSNTISLPLLGNNLSPGVYRLINYSGRKSGFFGGVIQPPIFNQVAIDESVTNQINLVVTAGATNPIVALGGEAVLESVTANPECSGLYPVDTTFNGFTALSDQLLSPLANIAVLYRGWQGGGNTSDILNGAHLIYRYRLDFDKPVRMKSIQLSGVAFNGPNSVFRLLDATTNPIAVWPTSGGNTYQKFSWGLPQTQGTTFFIDEYDTSGTWRYRDSIRVEFASVNVTTNLPRHLALASGQWLGLSFAATNPLPLGYQWQFNGQDLANATSHNLLLPNVQALQSGAYSVTVSNLAGAISTVVANLAVPTNCASPPPGLAAWWGGDNNAGDTVGTNQGVLQSGVGYTNGMVRQAFAFDGLSGAVLVPDNAALNFSTAVTIEGWVKLDDTNNTYFIATKQPSGTAANNYPGNFEFRVEPGGHLAFLHQTSTANTFSVYRSTTTLAPGAWHHVAATLAAGGRVNFFLDGVPAGSASQQGTFGITTAEPLRIGTRKDNLSYFKGVIDELSLYNRALAGSEIAALYNAWSQGKCADQLPPTIASQPQSQTVNTGQDATFVVGVRSPSPITCHWQFNGVDMTAPTNATLALPGIGLGADGFYSVWVGNSFGSVTSSPARLRVSAPGIVPFYFADFESAIGPEWSLGKRATAPAGQTYLGQLGAQAAVLTVTNCPPGASGIISFDLYIIDTWDGSDLSNGPDNWTLQANGGSLLVNATLSNCRTEHQSFPWGFGSGDFPWATGAVATNSLGYPHLGSATDYLGDTVYHLQFPFTNTSTSLGVRFAASGLGSLDDECWGLDNVAVYLNGHSGDGWPVVTTQPQSQTLLVGNSVDLSVTASGAAALGYQWFKDAVPLAGTTSPVLHLARAQTNDAGSYTVVVTNALGTTVSAPARLSLPPGAITPEDGPWGQQAIVQLNTPEAALMARSGDIDNLNFGWPTGFNPFAGGTTPAHAWPWTLDPTDPAGTDRIMVPSSFNGHPPHGQDGYTSTTTRPQNLPQAISLSYNLPELTNLVVASAALQMFVDDFQASVWGANFQITLNGTRAPFLEQVVNGLVQTGPSGQLVTVRIPDAFLDAVHSGQLSLLIDDPITGAGDGYAVDFVKLLINPATYSQATTLTGRITDALSGLPLSGAVAAAGTSVGGPTGADGRYTLTNIPSGLSVFAVSCLGYQGQTQRLATLANQPASLDAALLLTPPVLSLGNPAYSAGGLRLRLTGLTGVTPVVIFTATNLVDWAPAFIVPPTAGVYEILDTNAPGPAGKRFYRAAVATLPNPFLLSATPADSAVSLSWNPLAALADPFFGHYAIYRSTNVVSSLSGLAPIAVVTNRAASTFADLTATNGVAWYYAVTTVGIFGSEHEPLASIGPVVPIAPPVLRLALLSGGSAGGFSLTFDGFSNAAYHVWTSTNLLNWNLAGTADQTTSGHFLFNATSVPHDARRFYRVTSP